MMIDVFGTEEYYDNWTETSPVDEVFDVADYVEDEWNYFMAYDEYEIDVYGITHTEIPESELKSDVDDRDDLEVRREDMHDWLEDNWPAYDDVNIEAIIVLDYVEGNVPPGQARKGVAGRDWFIKDRIAWVNMEHFPTNGHHVETQHYGVAVHELMHTYGTEHEDGVIFSTEEASFMPQLSYDADDLDCYAHATQSTHRISSMSTCSVEEIEDHVDDHIN